MLSVLAKQHNISLYNAYRACSPPSPPSSVPSPGWRTKLPGKLLAKIPGKILEKFLGAFLLSRLSCQHHLFRNLTQYAVAVDAPPVAVVPGDGHGIVASDADAHGLHVFRHRGALLPS